jgi:hypothetical protein
MRLFLHLGIIVPIRYTRSEWEDLHKLTMVAKVAIQVAIRKRKEEGIFL